MTCTLFVIAAITVLSGGTSLAEATSKSRSPHKAMAIYAPPPRIPAEARAKHLGGKAICLLYVRPDGTVSHVEVAKSTGQPLLDQASIEAFSQWRFKPGTVKKVKIPITYTGKYTKAAKT